MDKFKTGGIVPGSPEPVRLTNDYVIPRERWPEIQEQIRKKWRLAAGPPEHQASTPAPLKTFVVTTDFSLPGDIFGSTAWVIFAETAEQAVSIAHREVNSLDQAEQYQYDCDEKEAAPTWAEPGICSRRGYCHEMGVIFDDDAQCEWCDERMDPENEPHWLVNDMLAYCVNCEEYAKDDPDGFIETIVLINGGKDAG